MNPLSIPLSQFNQRAFADYDLSFTFQCGDLGQLERYLETGRNDVLRQCRENAKLAPPGDDGMPKGPVWGPVIIGEATAVTSHVDVTQYYRLVPQGMENRFETTDGKTMADFRSSPPPLPNVIDASIPLHPSLVQGPPQIGIARHRPEIEQHLKQANEVIAGKLYRVLEAVEVTAEDVSAELGAKKRKNAKPAVYIRGSIVEPRLRVEI